MKSPYIHIFAYALTFLLLAVYVKHKTESFVLGKDSYRYAGMIEQTDGETKIYLPIYTRNK